MGKAYRVRLAESSLERAARMLTDDYEVKVVFKGDYAFTHENTIVMPAVPADAPDEYVEVMTGILFHEAGHKLYTDYSQHPAVQRDKSRFACINTIEDVRIESRLKRRFPGAANGLAAFHDTSAAILQRNWVKSTQLQRVLNGLVFTLSDGKSSPFYEFLDPITRQWVDESVSLVGDVGELLSTDEAVEVGNRLADFLEPLFDDHEENEQPSKNMQEQTSYGLQEQSELSKELAQEITAKDDGEGEEEDGTLEIEMASLRGDGTYRVYSTEKDVIEKIADVEHVTLKKDVTVSTSSLVQALRDSTADSVVTMRRKLLNTLRVLTESKWSRGHDEGDLDQDVLYEIPHRLNDHVFRQKLKNMELDVAVALAVDHSASMSGEKMTLATQCAITLGDVVQPLRIPFLVYGFSTTGVIPEGLPKDVAKYYARWCGHWIGVYHDFNDNWRDSCLRVSTAIVNRKQHTLDGESVMWGMRQLLARREKRKILFVLTDGQPDPGDGGVQARVCDHLSAITALATTVGVEVVAFGIQSPTVKVYYPNHVVLRSLDEIVREPLTKLDDALRKGRRFR